MKHFYIAILLLLFPVFMMAKSIDVGGGIGLTYYNGDINPDAMFYKVNPGFEGFVRYNFNSRYSLRGNVMVSDFEADDRDFIVKYQQKRRASFHKSIVEMGVMGEFNFFPFSSPAGWRMRNGSFFLLAGVIVGIPYSTSKDSSTFFGIPIGVGYKQNITGRLALQVEWTFRKTFTDYFDDLSDPLMLEEKSSFFNNDWYNLLSVKLSFNLFNGNKCRTFDRRR